MNTLTLSMVMNSRLPGIIGECAGNLNALRSIVNEAQERLLHDPLSPEGGWLGGWCNMVFSVQIDNGQGYIVAPHDVARLGGLTVCNRSIPIRNGFWEYLEYGTGLRDMRTCCDKRCQPLEAFERDSVVTLTSLVGTKRIDVYTVDDADYQRQVCIQGLDANGRPVVTMDQQTTRAVQGEWVTLEFPFASTMNQFSKLTSILKGSTLGAITFEQYDTAAGTSAPLTLMEPWENSSIYRRYLLSGLPGNCTGTAGIIQVTANAKLELIPAMSVSDRLLIQSIPALIEECQSMRYGSMDAPGASRKAQEHHAAALRLLFGQLDHYYGKTNTALEVQIFGSAPMRCQPL